MKLALLFLSAVLAVACVSDPSEKLGVAPSGPGQTTMARSQSVAIASDQSVVATKDTPTVISAVTKSDTTDTSTICARGVYVGHDAGASNIALVGTGTTYVDAAQAVTLGDVPNGTFIPGSFQRVMSTNTTSDEIRCLGN